MSLAIEKKVPKVKNNEEAATMKLGAHRMIGLFLLTIATAVSFHNFLHLPPAAGMMLGLGYLGVFSYYIKIREGREDRYDSILGQRPHETLHPLEALIQRRSNLSEFIREYSEPTFMIDNDHIVTYWNPAMEKLSGVPAGEVIGTRRHWYPFYEKERLILADLVLENFPKEEIGRHYGGHHKQVHSIEHAYETAAFFPTVGKKGKWLSIAAAPVKDDQGKVIGVVETLHDYTNMKRRTSHFDLMKRIARAEWDTLLFFYGVILCVGGISQFGYLALVSNYMYVDLGPTAANTAVGVLSAIGDNIPVMFAVLTMDPSMSHGQWLLVTLTAGVGGCLLAIGSAAGVGLLGTAWGIYTFGAHLKWTPAIALGYGLSILCHLVINARHF